MPDLMKSMEAGWNTLGGIVNRSGLDFDEVYKGLGKLVLSGKVEARISDKSGCPVYCISGVSTDAGAEKSATRVRTRIADDFDAIRRNMPTNRSQP